MCEIAKEGIEREDQRIAERLQNGAETIYTKPTGDKNELEGKKIPSGYIRPLGKGSRGKYKGKWDHLK